LSKSIAKSFYQIDRVICNPWQLHFIFWINIVNEEAVLL
jgi:hypothetical protein